MKIPYPPLNPNELTSNISYGEVQSLPFDDLSNWVDNLRSELLSKWEEGVPPYLGSTTKKIADRFKLLRSYPVQDFYSTDTELYKDYIGFIKNQSKVGSGCNQFFPLMLKTRINNRSIYDFLTADDLKLDFKHTIVNKVRFDKMYLYSKYLKKVDGKCDFRRFEEWVASKDDNIGFWTEAYNWNKYNVKDHHLKLGTKMIKKLVERGVLDQEHRSNEMGYDYKRDDQAFTIRYYDKNQRIFPKVEQILRIGLNQVPVNFNPLTAKFIYEKYLPDSTKKYTIVDPCSGWGGRLVGCLSSNRKTHYVGCDVQNQGSYEALSDFYNKNCDGKNTSEMFYDGFEEIHKNKEFQKYRGRVDLIFTSPPYFDREKYSDDDKQSYLKFPSYDEWKSEFLGRMIRTSFQYLKQGGKCIINIADIRLSRKKFIPIEQHTISLALQSGFKYEGKIGMSMVRTMGVNADENKNYWYDQKSRNIYKTEPLLIFSKPIELKN